MKQTARSPRLKIRETGPGSPPVPCKHASIPSLTGHGPSDLPDWVVAGVLWDLQTKLLPVVAKDWGISRETVRNWRDGLTRAHVKPKKAERKI